MEVRNPPKPMKFKLHSFPNPRGCENEINRFTSKAPRLKESYFQTFKLRVFESLSL